MNMLAILKIVVIIVVAVIFLFTAYKTMKALSGGKAFIYVIIEVVVFSALAYGVQYVVTQSFIKAELRNFHNTPIPTSEKLAVKGCVKNVGMYKASEVTLHIKVVNNALGGSFGPTNGRPQTFNLDTVVVTNLAKGTTKCFNKRFKYPPYFKLVKMTRHISVR